MERGKDVTSHTEEAYPEADSSKTEKARPEPGPQSGTVAKPRREAEAKDRFRGCLLGGAIGDALGAPVEFMSASEIRRTFGTHGVTDYAAVGGRVGEITDDTQMTLFTAEGLLRAHVRAETKGITTYPGVTASAYLRWLWTQGEKNVHFQGRETIESGWLIRQRGLQTRRAPGNTCLSALKAMDELGSPAKNDSKGCGGVMRVAPVGLFGWHFREQSNSSAVFKLGCELAGITHGHITGQLTAGVFAHLIMELTAGGILRDALAAAKDILRSQAGHEETLNAIEQAEALADMGLDHPRAIERLGAGWVAEEALAIAIYCALVAEDFRHGVLLAVNHGGDSDSTGAMAGNILGIISGEKGIPREWLAHLELHDLIAEVAEDLLFAPNYPNERYPDSDAIWEKYPGY